MQVTELFPATPGNRTINLTAADLGDGAEGGKYFILCPHEDCVWTVNLPPITAVNPSARVSFRSAHFGTVKLYAGATTPLITTFNGVPSPYVMPRDNSVAWVPDAAGFTWRAEAVDEPMHDDGPTVRAVFSTLGKPVNTWQPVGVSFSLPFDYNGVASRCRVEIEGSLGCSDDAVVELTILEDGAPVDGGAPIWSNWVKGAERQMLAFSVEYYQPGTLRPSEVKQSFQLAGRINCGTLWVGRSAPWASPVMPTRHYICEHRT